jgi:hypothetical protein
LASILTSAWKEARDKQAEARKLLRHGQDPAEVKRAQKRHAKSNAENSFENIAREWHSKQCRWTEDHAHRVLSSLEKEVFPRIGDKPLHEITAPAILKNVNVDEGSFARAAALPHVVGLAHFNISDYFF